jgi:hypothetical protein
MIDIYRSSRIFQKLLAVHVRWLPGELAGRVLQQVLICFADGKHEGRTTASMKFLSEVAKP